MLEYTSSTKLDEPFFFIRSKSYMTLICRRFVWRRIQLEHKLFYLDWFYMFPVIFCVFIYRNKISLLTNSKISTLLNQYVYKCIYWLVFDQGEQTLSTKSYFVLTLHLLAIMTPSSCNRSIGYSKQRQPLRLLSLDQVSSFSIVTCVSAYKR
jgi:hypothetical protein